MRKMLLMLSMLMMMISLFSCATPQTCPKIDVLIPEPLKIERYRQGELNCLTPELKKLILHRQVSCETRVDTLMNKLENVNK